MNRIIPGLILATALIVSACESDIAPTGFADRSEAVVADEATFASKVPTDFLDEGKLRLGVFTVCKIAEDDPTQDFHFDATIFHEGDPVNTSTSDVDLMDGECFDFHTAQSGGLDPDSVSVTEEALAGWLVNGITIYGLDEDVACDPSVHDYCIDVPGHGNLGVIEMVDPPGVYTHGGFVDNDKLGCVLVYENVMEETGAEGCTPGAWKNRLLRIGAWGPTGYTPGQSVASVFASAAGVDSEGTDLGSVSLLEALSLQGGDSFGEKVEILLRAATAAVLNAAHPGVDYPMTESAVIDAVNDAIDSGDPQIVVDVAADLDTNNNLGCDITDGD